MRRIVTAVLFGAVIAAAPAMAATKAPTKDAAAPAPVTVFKGVDVSKTKAKDDLYRAYAWLYRHDFERAMFLVESALRKGLSKDDQALAYEYRGQAYMMQKKNDEAIADFTKAVGLDKYQFAANANRGLIYAQQGKYDLAVADYSQALTGVPNRDNWLAGRADAYFRLGQFDKAVADYDKAIKVNAKLGSYFNGRGRAYLKKGDSDKAIADFDAAIMLRPEDSTALYNRGLAKRAKGDAAGATADIAQARKFNVNIGKSPDIK